MPSTVSLLARFSQDFPAISFVPGSDFRWSADKRTIFYDKASSNSSALIHEVAHAVLNHQVYKKDIQLIEMERDAWEYARTQLAPKYGVTLADDTIQDALDTYRNWLHARSTCPGCDAVGLQLKKNRYKCLACLVQWRVNDARLCELRRYVIAS